MGLQYEHETFGERNAIEGWFNILKARLKRFWKRFPSNPSKESIERMVYRVCSHLQSGGENFLTVPVTGIRDNIKIYIHLMDFIL